MRQINKLSQETAEQIGELPLNAADENSKEFVQAPEADSNNLVSLKTNLEATKLDITVPTENAESETPLSVQTQKYEDEVQSK